MKKFSFSYSNSSNATIIKKLCKSKKLVKLQHIIAWLTHTGIQFSSSRGLKKFPYLKTGPFGNPIFLYEGLVFGGEEISIPETWPIRKSYIFHFFFTFRLFRHFNDSNLISLIKIHISMIQRSSPIQIFFGYQGRCHEFYSGGLITTTEGRPWDMYK